jgi:hypothetical protein
MGSLVPSNFTGLYQDLCTASCGALQTFNFLQPMLIGIIINGTAVFIMPGYQEKPR